jgi:hypothetical protein
MRSKAFSKSNLKIISLFWTDETNEDTQNPTQDSPGLSCL